MLHCINNSNILKESLELLSNNDYENIIKNEFETMCIKFGLNCTQMISLVTTLDTTLLNDHYNTIWDGLNYYSMACMDDYKTAYIKSLYKTDLMDDRIENLCDDLKEYIKCSSCINIENNKCSTFKNACDIHHDTCIKYLLNNPQKHDAKNDIYSDYRNYGNTNIIDYMCECGASLNIIKYLFEVKKEKCTSDAIESSCCHGRLDVVAYLIEIQNVHVDLHWSLVWAIESNYFDIVKYLFEMRGDGPYSSLIDCAQNDDMKNYVKKIENDFHGTQKID